MNMALLQKSTIVHCAANSVYHELKWGHRIQTGGLEACGRKCVKQDATEANATVKNLVGKLNRLTPFICTDCLVIQLELEIVLEAKMTITRIRRGAKAGDINVVRDIALKMIAHRVRDGRRICKTAAKVYSAKEQLLEDFMADVPNMMADYQATKEGASYAKAVREYLDALMLKQIWGDI